MAISFEKTQTSVIIKYIEQTKVYQCEILNTNKIITKYCDNNFDKFLHLIKEYYITLMDDYVLFTVSNPIVLKYKLTTHREKVQEKEYPIQENVENKAIVETILELKNIVVENQKKNQESLEKMQDEFQKFKVNAEEENKRLGEIINRQSCLIGNLRKEVGDLRKNMNDVVLCNIEKMGKAQENILDYLEAQSNTREIVESKLDTLATKEFILKTEKRITDQRGESQISSNIYEKILELESKFNDFTHYENFSKLDVILPKIKRLEEEFAIVDMFELNKSYRNVSYVLSQIFSKQNLLEHELESLSVRFESLPNFENYSKIFPILVRMEAKYDPLIEGINNFIYRYSSKN